MTLADANYDLLVIGGGINGVGIARDAAGRGLSVLLCEKGDLASATSASSSKLIHGGLRYLEHYEFRLVAEALTEREVLLHTAAHLVEPLTFVMPHVPGLRPRWMIRLGLFFYDHLGRHSVLPGSHGVALCGSPYAAGLRPVFARGFAYSDCRVDDARLVLANALDARELGATIMTGSECVNANRSDGIWHATLRGAGGAQSEVAARAIVNVAGPWVKQVLNQRLNQPSRDNVKLVKGSHIVVPRAYPGEHAFILQNDDRRVVFMIPYQGRFTLIGTTDVPLAAGPDEPSASAEEINYLCRAVNRYLARPATPADVVWSYAGVRPLYDDGTADPSAITRDYTLRLDADTGVAPVLSVFGGKITTYRRLAERALAKLAPWFPHLRPEWTAQARLPGADFGAQTPGQFARDIIREFVRLPQPLLQALLKRHGSWCRRVLDGARTVDDLGEHFGADLYAREVDYMTEREWARSGADVLWRRTKAGLHLSGAQRSRVVEYVAIRARGR